MNELLVTIPEAAKRLSVGRTSIYEMINAGDLPVWRHGRAIRIPVAELQAMVEKQLQAGN